MHDQFQHHQGLCGLYQRLSHQQYVTECCATGGFAGVLGPEADNSLVFERAFKVKPSLYEDVKSLQEALRMYDFLLFSPNCKLSWTEALLHFFAMGG